MTRISKAVAIFLLFLSISFVFWGMKFVWWRISASTVTMDGVVLPDSTLYRSSRGDYVLLIEYDGEEQALYVIRSNEHEVGIQSRLKFLKTPYFMLSFEDPVYPITSDSAKSAALDPKLKIEPRGLYFVVYPSREIDVLW